MILIALFTRYGVPCLMNKLYIAVMFHALRANKYITCPISRTVVTILTFNIVSC